MLQTLQWSQFTNAVPWEHSVAKCDSYTFMQEPRNEK